jgi:hypothetical protein
MAKKEVSVIISAKNAMARGLSAAGRSLQQFGQSAARIGAFFAKSFLAAGAAIVGLGIKAVTAFAAQEKAEKAAAAALAAYGDEVTGNLAKIKRFAAAIQNETGISDENLIARAARLRMLGVEADQLEQATKATVALASAGMAEEEAIKAVANAQAGNFEQLKRSIPALKNATTEAEKAQIVNDFLTRGYQAQKDELHTVAGRWGDLKGRISDAWEEIGAAIAQNGELTGALKRAGDAVQRFGERVREWVSGGGVGRMIDTIKNFGNEARNTFEQIGAYARYGIDNAWASVKWFGSAVTTTFRNAGKIIKATWENTTDQAGYYLARLHAKVTGQEWNLKPPEMKDIFEGIDEIPERGAEAAERLDARLAELEDKRKAREIELRDEVIAAHEAVADAAEAAADVEVAAAERIDIARVNNLKLAEQEIAAAKKKMQVHGEMAKKTIADILAENKAREEGAKAWAKDERRAAELQKRQERGTKLSRRQQEWLDAFGQIKGARAGLQAGRDALQMAKDQLAAAKDQGEKLADIRDEIQKLDQDLLKLLERGG